MVSVAPYSVDFYVYAVGAAYGIWLLFCIVEYIRMRKETPKALVRAISLFVIGEGVIGVLNWFDVRLGTVMLQIGIIMGMLLWDVRELYGKEKRLASNGQYPQTVERPVAAGSYDSEYQGARARTRVPEMVYGEGSGVAGRRQEDVLQHPVVERDATGEIDNRLQEMQELWKQKGPASAPPTVPGQDRGRGTGRSGDAVRFLSPQHRERESVQREDEKSWSGRRVI